MKEQKWKEKRGKTAVRNGKKREILHVLELERRRIYKTYLCSQIYFAVRDPAKAKGKRKNRWKRKVPIRVEKRLDATFWRKVLDVMALQTPKSGSTRRVGGPKVGGGASGIRVILAKGKGEERGNRGGGKREVGGV